MEVALATLAFISSLVMNARLAQMDVINVLVLPALLVSILMLLRLKILANVILLHILK
jgi:hypothetical protein